MRAQLISSLAGLTATALLVTAIAFANDEVRFGAADVPTVFYISKSDDRNRVDYGMRLTEGCAPLGSEAVFPYWREFEKSPPVRTHPLGTFEYFGYGISEQRMVRGGKPDAAYLIRLRQFKQRPVWITTSRDDSGRCRARVRCAIGAVRFAELSSIYLKLAGPLSVEYIIIKGHDPATGNPIEEKIKR
ncbi:MAG TPA: DUF4833 domain-containing protein [Polyangiaceae bacterium]|nr:DUF4833 domain-containing protein [Polyangiaceae bacterium]